MELNAKCTFQNKAYTSVHNGSLFVLVQFDSLKMNRFCLSVMFEFFGCIRNCDASSGSVFGFA